jgi:hypothetical protein
MKLHLQDQVSQYGSQSLINLVNQKGREQPVKEAYESAVSKVRCHYTASAFYRCVLGGIPGRKVSILRLPQRVQTHAMGSYWCSHREDAR